MKFAASLLILSACPAPSFAADNVVRWRQIVGVITAPNVDNPVAGISAGTAPWTTRGGNARVDLTTGSGSFDVEGLVLNGGSATGTPGPITSVVGTLVCNWVRMGRIIRPPRWFSTPPPPLSAPKATPNSLSS